MASVILITVILIAVILIAVILITVILITRTRDPCHRKPNMIPAILILRGGIWRKMSVNYWICLSSS